MYASARIACEGRETLLSTCQIPGKRGTGKRRSHHGIASRDVCVGDAGLGAHACHGDGAALHLQGQFQRLPRRHYQSLQGLSVLHVACGPATEAE